MTYSQLKIILLESVLTSAFSNHISVNAFTHHFKCIDLVMSVINHGCKQQSLHECNGLTCKGRGTSLVLYPSPFIASFPGSSHMQKSCTASNGKLGMVWEQGCLT